MNILKSQFFDTREETERWLDKYKIENYTINDDLSVDAEGSVDIAYKDLEFIPINFVKVMGHFWCNNNKLTNLIGFAFPSVRSPKTVGGVFVCRNNNLTSLIGSPETVGKSFCCNNNNKLINLVDSPKSVSGAFWCHKNKLISLEGSPKFIGGDFCCEHNLLTSLIEIINCNFNTEMYFNIDTEKFKQKELIQALEQYYNNTRRCYQLTNIHFHNTIKPILEKELLEKKLINSRTKDQIKPSFV